MLRSRGRFPLTIAVLVGLAAGVIVGAIAGPRAAFLGEIGRLVVQGIKVAAIPLLMLAIVNGVLGADIKARSGLRMAALASFNATIALAFGLFLSNALQPGRHLTALVPPGAPPVTAERIEPMKVIENLVPQSLAQPFAENAILPLVLMSLLGALALRRVRSAGETTAALEHALSVAQRASEIVLTWIIHLVPLAVFGVVAKAVGQHGVAALGGLGWYLGVGLLGLALHPLVTYQLWLGSFARIRLGRFWSAAREPMVYAVGTNSSLATLPVTLRALDRLGVSKGSAALGACVGTNLNNDGIILYEAMAVLFVAQAHGLELTLGQQVLAAISCLVAAMGIAGVPEAGFVSLSLVLATVGLPLEVLPLLLTVDWILARARSIVNVLSDMMVSILLDRWDGRRFDQSPAAAAVGATSGTPRTGSPPSAH